jgi:hypothetical protein
LEVLLEVGCEGVDYWGDGVGVGVGGDLGQGFYCGVEGEVGR